jgi:hypothetical protein
MTSAFLAIGLAARDGIASTEPGKAIVALSRLPLPREPRLRGLLPLSFRKPVSKMGHRLGDFTNACANDERLGLPKLGDDAD